MDIVKQIQTRFPLDYSISNRTGKAVALTGTEKLPEHLQNRLREEMRKLRLPLSQSGASGAAEVSLQTDPETVEECLCLRFRDQRFFFRDADPSVSLAWTLFAISQELPFLQKIQTARMQACIFSAGQQTLASSLLSTLEYWQTSVTEGSLDKDLVETLNACVEELLPAAPLYSGRAVTEGGMALIRAQNRVFARQINHDLRSLSDILYGKGSSFRKELERYCLWVRDSEPVREAKRAFTEKLFLRPVKDMDMRLREAFRRIDRTLSNEERAAAAKVRDSLRRTLRLRQVIPAELYKEVDAAGEKLAGCMLKRAMAETLEKCVEEILKGTLPEALRCIDEWSDSLQRFCRIDRTCRRLDIGWDSCTHLQVENLPCPADTWNRQLLSELQAGVGTQGQYVREAWFCGPRAVSDVDPAWREITHSLPQMSEQIAVELLSDILSLR